MIAFFLGYVTCAAVFLAAWAATVPLRDCDCEDDDFEPFLAPLGYRRIRLVEDREPYDWKRDGL